MPVATWPPSLPQSPQKGFTESGGVLILRTPTDSGPPKQRARGSKPNILNLQYLMTTAQVATFETFVKSTLRGTAKFTVSHPRTGSTVQTRIIPQGEGDLYSLSYQAPGYYLVSLQLEVLP